MAGSGIDESEMETVGENDSARCAWWAKQNTRVVNDAHIVLYTRFFFLSPFFLFLLYISYIYFSSLLVLSSITQTELSFFLLAASAAAAATAAADEVGAVKLKRWTPPWLEFVHPVGGRGGRGSVEETCTNDWLINSSCSPLYKREQEKKSQDELVAPIEDERAVQIYSH